MEIHIERFASCVAAWLNPWTKTLFSTERSIFYRCLPCFIRFPSVFVIRMTVVSAYPFPVTKWNFPQRIWRRRKLDWRIILILVTWTVSYKQFFSRKVFVSIFFQVFWVFSRFSFSRKSRQSEVCWGDDCEISLQIALLHSFNDNWWSDKRFAVRGGCWWLVLGVICGCLSTMTVKCELQS